MDLTLPKQVGISTFYFKTMTDNNCPILEQMCYIIQGLKQLKRILRGSNMKVEFNVAIWKIQICICNEHTDNFVLQQATFIQSPGYTSESYIL